MYYNANVPWVLCTNTYVTAKNMIINLLNRLQLSVNT